jgi:U3 small nucleolar RNA-associated protein 12
MRTDEEVLRKRARRKKREKEKKEKGRGKKQDDTMDVDDSSEEIKLIDIFTPHSIIRTSGKIRSFEFSPHDSSSKIAAQVS